MKRYEVVFTPEAQEHLLKLYRRIARRSTPDVAQRYTNAVVRYCEGFTTFPARGRKRDDIRPGIRTIGYRRRRQIAYIVEEEERRISIIGVFHGGQDYEAALKAEDPED
jgi:toxin ParE1/3/4